MSQPSTGTMSHAALGADASRNLPDAGVSEPYRPPTLELLELSRKTRLGSGGTTDGGTPGQGTS